MNEFPLRPAVDLLVAHTIGAGLEGAKCSCGWQGTLREAGVHLLEDRERQVTDVLTRMKDAGFPREG